MILSCDPGFKNFGYAVIDENGRVTSVDTIQTKKLAKGTRDDINRVTQIVTVLNKVIHMGGIKCVLAELPPGGSKSNQAAKGLAYTVSLLTTICALKGLPIEWATPAEVKTAVTGKQNASKTAMMKTICDKYGWKISYKKIYSKSTSELQRKDPVYHPLCFEMGKNKFEHIADALGVFEALKSTDTVRFF